MGLPLLLVLGVPVVLLPGAAIFATTRVVQALWQRRIPSISALVGLVVGLLLIDGVLSLLVVLNASLGHSEQAKQQATWICVAMFVLIVLGPAAALSLRVRSIRASQRVDPTPGA